MRRLLRVLVVSLSMQGGAGYAQSAPPTAPVEGGTSPPSSMAEGEVRKVDADAAKITLRHGEIANLEMPAMTMVFQVKDKSIIGRVKVGDKVRFTADKIGGLYTITHIEPAN